MPRTSRILAATAGVVVLLGGCGDGAGGPAAAPPTTIETSAPGTPPTTIDPDDAVGGFGPPAPAATEFDLTATWAIAGTTDLDERGCWWIEGDGGRGLLLAPTGTRIGDAGDTLVVPEGRIVANDDPLDIDGVVLYRTDDLPGGADGRWGNYLAFCGSGSPVVVAKALSVPADTDLATAPVELADLGAALFDTDHGCGYGFATGSTDGRWALQLYATGSEPIESGTITLPDERFDAVVLVGRHLFANHCDDVVEWFEPQRTVAATWPIVAGSFDYPGSDGTGDCSQGAVTATLVDAAVDVDGAVVPLGPVTIENRSFGCFGG